MKYSPCQQDPATSSDGTVYSPIGQVELRWHEERTVKSFVETFFVIDTAVWRIVFGITALDNLSHSESPLSYVHYTLGYDKSLQTEPEESLEGNLGNISAMRSDKMSGKNKRREMLAKELSEIKFKPRTKGMLKNKLERKLEMMQLERKLEVMPEEVPEKKLEGSLEGRTENSLENSWGTPEEWLVKRPEKRPEEVPKMPKETSEEISKEMPEGSLERGLKSSSKSPGGILEASLAKGPDRRLRQNMEKEAELYLYYIRTSMVMKILKKELDKQPGKRLKKSVQPTEATLDNPTHADNLQLNNRVQGLENDPDFGISQVPVQTISVPIETPSNTICESVHSENITSDSEGFGQSDSDNDSKARSRFSLSSKPTTITSDYSRLFPSNFGVLEIVEMFAENEELISMISKVAPFIDRYMCIQKISRLFKSYSMRLLEIADPDGRREASKFFGYGRKRLAKLLWNALAPYDEQYAKEMSRLRRSTTEKTQVWENFLGRLEIVTEPPPGSASFKAGDSKREEIDEQANATGASIVDEQESTSDGSVENNSRKITLPDITEIRSFLLNGKPFEKWLEDLREYLFLHATLPPDDPDFDDDECILDPLSYYRSLGTLERAIIE